MRTNATIASPAARIPLRQHVSSSELERFFAGINSRMEEPETNVAQVSPSVPLDQPELKQFFTAVSHRVESADRLQRRIDKRQATGFNVFDLIEPDENKLSDILAGLLDPKGGHGQGDLFLRLLFNQLNLGTDGTFTKEVKVQREAPTHGIMKYRRRIDVLVKAGALLALENKVDSLEQRDQIKDYLDHLSYCTRGRTIQTALIYLTRDGNPPKSLHPSVEQKLRKTGKLHCWSHQVQLRAWLKSCRQQCAARKIQDFLSDYIAYIESALKRESQYNQEVETDER